MNTTMRKSSKGTLKKGSQGSPGIGNERGGAPPKRGSLADKYRSCPSGLGAHAERTGTPEKDSD